MAKVILIVNEIIAFGEPHRLKPLFLTRLLFENEIEILGEKQNYCRLLF